MNWMGKLQQLGRALMLPMMVLPVAAIMQWLGGWSWHAIGLEPVSEILTFSASLIFQYLPFMFAVGVALGLTENASTAGLSALIGYFVFTETIANLSGSPINLGTTGGIVIGIVAAWTYFRFRNIRLPEYIQLIGGTRLVPGFVVLFSILAGFLAVTIGSYAKHAFGLLGDVLLSLDGFGTFLYGVSYRLLVPSGLHHILNNVFWFQLGSFELPDGRMVYGDLPRFFAGDSTAGIYMTGLYPIMMFALPAVAIAIIQEAREDLKPKVKKVFLIAALTSFLTGVTEPIEFAFLFVAPVLFFAHAILSGISMWLTYELGIRLGFSFSAGAIDLIINQHLATNVLWLLPIGLGYGLLYYFLFRWAIRRYQLPTPGREEGSSMQDWAGDIPFRSPLILQALGGKNNIKTIEACITRLRLTLVNDNLVDIAALKHLGSAGVIRLGSGNVQVVFGTFSEMIREEIVRLTKKDLQHVMFQSPVQGKMIPLDEVPDAIFSGKLVGDGVAFIPERGELVSPVAGKIVALYPSMHAIGIETEEGLQVLLHIGIDTSNLPEPWFKALVKIGDQVERGQMLIKFPLQKIKQHAKSLATPMVITNPEKVRSWSYAPFKMVKQGQASVMSVVLKEPDAAAGGDTNG